MSLGSFARVGVSILCVAGCSDDEALPSADAGNDNNSQCPDAKPNGNSACNLDSEIICKYLLEECPCFRDLEAACLCHSNRWKCARMVDCYPCPDSGSN